MAMTKIADLINPEVLAPMISAKIEKKLLVSKVAHIDTTLTGQAGNEVTVPQYNYIGDAEDVAEGVAMGTAKLTTSVTKFTIKKIGKATEITDEAMLSGYGDPVGESENQLSTAIASKIDNDVVECITKEYASVTAEDGIKLVYDGSAKVISYAGVVDAEDLFDEEISSDKVLYVHPKQMTQLRKDPDFISADKYDGKVMTSGEVGKIGTCRVVRSKKVPLNDAGTYYLNPIVKLTNDSETEKDAHAVTIFLKRDTQVENDRDILAGVSTIAANKHYGVALTNATKVVLAKFKK